MIMQPRLTKIVANLNMCSASLTCSPLALLIRTQPADLALHPSAMKDHVKAHSKHVQSMLIKILAKAQQPKQESPERSTEHLHIGVPSHLWKVELSKDILKSEQSPAPGARQKTKFLGLLEKKAAIEVILATTWQELP